MNCKLNNHERSAHLDKGIIYVMSTVVPGLIKIGKTGTNNFQDRMYHLERNGYSNITGLKRQFAIEVEDYSAKERLLGEIFNKSQVPNTELFALDIELVIQLLSSFEGRQIYPTEKSKDQVFDEAVKERQINTGFGNLPDGEYYLERNVAGFGIVKGKAVMQDGIFKVLRGAICAPSQEGYVHRIRRETNIQNNVLVEDIICQSPSEAGWVVIGRSNNGRTEWKDKHHQPIQIYFNNN